MTDEADKTNAGESFQPIEEELVAYLDGELEDEASRLLEQRLTSDPKLRQELAVLERTWDLLDGLGSSELDETFARSTIEMVAVEAEAQLHQQEEARPLRARRRRLVVMGGLAAAALAGFVSVWLFWPNPNQQLLEDLPVLERLDQYRQVDDVEFLRKLDESGLFAVEGTDEP